MSEEERSLDAFFLSGNVKPIKDAKDINQKEDFYMYVGSNWCPHSQLGTTHFSEACGVKKKDGSDRSCYGLDLGREEGGKIAEELKLPSFSGVPAMVKWDSKKKEFQKVATGRRMSPEVLDLFEKSESGKPPKEKKGGI